ncbi:hypothetical protein KXV70_008845 [Aspergillus fumigatus]|nr:hypothetical protein KXX64_003803 [Aspergillus fumigatus]KAH2562270.1 hypothetical protein KXV70_008845 [Aspergillus fumigatus]KAH2949678.1 hypothetical protein KXV49_003902 [Aspergillus fumigatus]KAH3247543.1 hypothetical protein KXW31_001172 [Aspergillus fumigatus]KAH3621764.1 hypothetical protein KXW67_003427 [Aspergillus fumigatus]
MFSKPINNLSGAGAGARIIHTLDEYWRSFVPGHMWSALLTGEHISTDIAVDAGRAVWFAHTKGVAGPDKTWEYWEVNTPVEPSLEKYITDFVEPHLAGYTGMMNVETIGGKIIEVHLRFSPQWPNMYGSWFIASLVDLYCGKGWTGPSASKIASPVGYSVPLWDDEKYAETGTTLTENAVRRLESMFNVESIVESTTMQYGQEKPLESTPRASGGFRIAWVNGFDLARCKLARSALQAYLYQLDDTDKGYQVL